MVKSIACWSGPRNLSTALMYAFAARGDYDIWDEPFYAAYLNKTGLDHPMRAEILAAGETDPQRVAACCAERRARPVYQKHMTQHMVWGLDHGWFDAVTHVFLIRHPARVLASYARKRENPTLADIGFAQQAALYEAVRARGLPTIVIDSADIRKDPKAMLDALCTALGIGFTPAMLSWPAGGHPDDGVWAPHWYGEVHRSTGFAGPEGPLPDLPEALQSTCRDALPYYEAMLPDALRPSHELP